MQFEQEWLDERAMEIADKITSCKAIDTEGKAYPGELGKEIDGHTVRLTGYWHPEDVDPGAGLIRMEMYDQNNRLALFDEKEEPVFLIEDEGAYCQARLSIIAKDITEESDG